ncbi:MAG: 2-amino-4-hydroxy-6-hydroxymethyldihydropteridine diphosphokinase [Treponema sp.]|nr:2-amino-4-hydroxy-6-hydroxymethyldihydropteridine diphosphokinase [Treponema sp.]
MRRILLGLGSNRSFNGMSPIEILRKACFRLTEYISSPFFSSVYKTKAMYVENQEDFYNMVVYGFIPDDLNPFDFLHIINSIEADYGRDRDKEIRFGPRSLDIDIELFGDECINTEVLQIPHPRMEERAFVLVPALEILPENADEIIREKYSECLKQLKLKAAADDITLFMSPEKLLSLQVEEKNGTDTRKQSD